MLAVFFTQALETLPKPQEAFPVGILARPMTARASLGGRKLGEHTGVSPPGPQGAHAARARPKVTLSS